MIYSISPGWARAPETSSFANAWSVIVNALTGKWGEVLASVGSSAPIACRVYAGQFFGQGSASVSETVTVNVPGASRLWVLAIAPDGSVRGNFGTSEASIALSGNELLLVGGDL